MPWWLPFGHVEEITPPDMRALLKKRKDIQLLDVRSPVEYGNGHIAGAKNVPIQELPRRLDALGLDPKRPVIAICLSGHRSAPAYRLLRSKGYHQVYSLSGGMMAWWRNDHRT